MEIEKDPDAEIVTSMGTHYLLQPPGENNGNMLPGAVLLDDKKFEASEEKVTSKRRDANVLPGAIGLEGKFDDSNENLADLLRASLPEPNNEKLNSAPGKSSKTPDAKKSGNGSKSKKKQQQTPQTSKKASEKSATSTSSSGANKNDKGTKRNTTDTESSSKSDSELSDRTSVVGEDKESTDSNKNSSKNSSSAKGKGQKGKGGKGEVSGASGKSKKLPQPTSSGPLYTGPHPMNRNMSELQVPGDATLDDANVREHYGKLVRAYLAPFANGITRKSFFEILRRRTYSLAPPGSNKGIQTLLFQLLDKSKLCYWGLGSILLSRNAKDRIKGCCD